MRYLIVDVLGFSGVAGEKKGTLGDSAMNEGSSLGQYGSLAEAKAAKVEQLKAIAGVAQSGGTTVVGGGGMYNPLNNRPMNR